MKLLTLRLSNFMGARDFTLDLQGDSATIRGTNASGKTSTFSAFTWLLFGKDASGQAVFDIKTIGADGEALHNLEHTVEGTFEVGDETLTLKKTYVEVWTKKRGSSTSEFTGHRVDHHIDGVPVQKKEYDARISAIAPEGVFRLLTDPDAFNALPWKDRRTLLLDVCGDVTDADVIDSDPELADLPGILGKRSLDDARKVVDARRREINRELQAVPVRIDEATQGRPVVPSESREKLDAKLATLRDARTALERQRARLEAGGEIAEVQARVREAEGKIADTARKVTAGAEEALATARRERDALKDAEQTTDRALLSIDRDLSETEAETAQLDARLADLRTRWGEVNGRTPPHASTPDSCAACGQALPAEHVQAAQARALDEFNVRKAKDLEDVQARGQRARQEREALTSKLEELRQSLESANQTQLRAATAARDAAARVNDLDGSIPDPTQDPTHQTLTAAKAKLEQQIESLREGNTDTLAGLRADVLKLDAEINDLVQSIGAIDNAAKADARIRDLAAQEKTLSREFEELERHLHLFDTFTRAKVALLTERINTRFSITRWRLFEDQINGGLTDACTAMVAGVPYGSGLNRAGRINCGLDIIRVLQDHHQFYPPVFIDEAESIIETLPLDTQVIRLIVDERHPTLTVQLDATQEVAA